MRLGNELVLPGLVGDHRPHFRDAVIKIRQERDTPGHYDPMMMMS